MIMLIKYLLFLVLLCFRDVMTYSLRSSHACSNDTKQFRNDYTYDHRANGWFKVHPISIDWHTARLICHSEGAELAAPLNPEMLESIKDLVENHEPKLSVYFAGVHQSFGSGVYTSVDGIPLEHLYIPNWYVGEPNNYGRGQNCLVFSRDKTIWDTSCDDYLPYICYRKYSKDEELTECGTVDTEYELDERTNSCYKYHKDAVTWEMAHKICQAEGGHLAVINSVEEAKILTDLLDVSPKPYFTPHTDVIAIGHHKWGKDDGWWTVQGQKLHEAGFDQWLNTTKTNLQNCGGFMNGNLDDIKCDEAYGFICEKTTDSLTKIIDKCIEPIDADSTEE